LWDFIDQPVKHYSSGMYLRLAFAVAVHTDPEILLVDEILAVGDERFQQKCLMKMENFKQSGVTIVIVSHSIDLVSKFTKRAIWIESSLLKQDDETQKVVEKYHKN